ncbi:unnamed protein product [Withania somnifera]
MDVKHPQPPPSSVIIRRTTRSGSGSIILGKYKLGPLLGRGSFAKVYHAFYLDDNSEYAVKVINKTTTIIDASMEPRIIREVSAMRRLNHHPNILKLHEVMATKTKIYFVMELAHGGELFTKLNRRGGRFSESTARFYFHQLVCALHFCHQNGVAHRDIKPQNLLLDKEGLLKISDFGLSALPEQLRNGLLHTACGTPAYTAPEVVYRKGYDGSKADAWSCGVILFVFLVGRLPFEDSNLPNMHKAMHRREFVFPDWVSKPAKRIINRLLDPNPETRYGIDELMNTPWLKKSSMMPEQSRKQFGEGILDKEGKHRERMNAFDIISMSSGLDLSGLFEVGWNNKEMRFTTNVQVTEVEEKVMKLGRDEGYRVERRKNGGIGLVRSRVVLLVEIFEVAKELWLVEFKVVNGGSEFEDCQWEELKIGLKDIVVSWYNDGS